MAKSISKTCMCKVADGKLGKHKDEYIELVSSPNFYCEKCLRVSAVKSNLCKPKKLK